MRNIHHKKRQIVNGKGSVIQPPWQSSLDWSLTDWLKSWLWACPVILFFWEKVILFLMGACALLNYLSVSWKLPDGQWTICALTTAKRLILQHWRRDKCSHPVNQWTEDLRTLSIFDHTVYSFFWYKANLPPTFIFVILFTYCLSL